MIRLLDWLFPRACPICREPLGSRSAQLCPRCTAIWESEAALTCPHCGKTADRCACLPVSLRPLLTPIDGRALISVGFYQPPRAKIHAQLVYRLKDSRDDSAARIFARVLSAEISRRFICAGEDVRAWTFTYAPRTAARQAETGVDPAGRLAKLCAAQLGAPFADVFRRDGGTEQKSLGSSARIENVESLHLADGARISGGSFLLLDDIVTSGATLARCASLLLGSGAKAVTAAAPLITPYTAKKTPELWFQK